jgi:hypothetical protein
MRCPVDCLHAELAGSPRRGSKASLPAPPTRVAPRPQICGGELFTSLCAYMASAWWEGRVSIWTCLRFVGGRQGVRGWGGSAKGMQCNAGGRGLLAVCGRAAAQPLTPPSTLHCPTQGVGRVVVWQPRGHLHVRRPHVSRRGPAPAAQREPFRFTKRGRTPALPASGLLPCIRPSPNLTLTPQPQSPPQPPPQDCRGVVREEGRLRAAAGQQEGGGARGAPSAKRRGRAPLTACRARRSSRRGRHPSAPPHNSHLPLTPFQCPPPIARRTTALGRALCWASSATGWCASRPGCRARRRWAAGPRGTRRATSTVWGSGSSAAPT